MGTTTRMSFAEFLNLPEREGMIYELDDGQLLMEASPAALHNLIRQRIALRLLQCLEPRNLGIVLEETDFRLSSDTVRNPDVAFVTTAQVEGMDLAVSPLEGAPALAVEVVFPSDTAEDMAKKTQQYLRAGAHAVWIVYSKIRLVEEHSSGGVRLVREPEVLGEDTLLPGFSVSLTHIFDGKE